MNDAKKSWANKYKFTIGGVMFPIIATIIEIFNHGYDFSLRSVFEFQSVNSILWMIDCSPFVLGFFAYQIDKRQEMLVDQNENLEMLVADRSKEINRQKLFYEALMQNIPIAVVTLDKNHRVVSVNPAFTKMFGHDQEDIIGVALDPLVANPEHLQQAEEITLGVLSGRGMHEFGKRKRKDGSLIDVEIFGQPIIVNDSMIGALGLYRDITVEKEAEAALRSSEERFRVMFSDSPVALRMEDYSAIKRWVDAVQKKRSYGYSGLLTFQSRGNQKTAGAGADH